MKKYHLEEKFALTGFQWEMLQAIYEDYTGDEKQKKFKKAATELSRLFAENEIAGKHSVTSRCKDPEHLLEKIIRNAAGETSGSSVRKYKMINRDNYEKLITDLVGVRILVLAKEDWEGVHDFIMERFEHSVRYYWDYREPDYGFRDEPDVRWIVEEPVAYVRYGDEDIFKKKLKTKYTHKDYCSQHYILKYHNVYCEVQVRTLAEEVYGEFDHKVRYPYRKDNRFLNRYTSMLSKVTVATDSILSLCMHLPDDLIAACNDCYEEEKYPQYNIESANGNEDETFRWGTKNILEASNKNLERRL